MVIATTCPPTAEAAPVAIAAFWEIPKPKPSSTLAPASIIKVEGEATPKAALIASMVDVPMLEPAPTGTEAEPSIPLPKPSETYLPHSSGLSPAASIACLKSKSLNIPSSCPVSLVTSMFSVIEGSESMEDSQADRTGLSERV